MIAMESLNCFPKSGVDSSRFLVFTKTSEIGCYGNLNLSITFTNASLFS